MPVTQVTAEQAPKLGEKMYELKQGTHYEANEAHTEAIKFHRGPTDPPVYLMSDRPLDKIFENKFVEVTEAQLRRLAPASPERVKAVRGLIDQGLWGKEDKDFLEHLSEDHFLKVAGPAVHAKKGPHEDKGSPPGEKTSSLGEEVTHHYPEAEENSLRVFKNPAGKHQVTKQDAPTKPINKEPLDAKEVGKWIQKMKKEL